jgi:hypothetical protein
MKIKSFGCSFIYGNDLKDCPHGINENNPPPSQYSWPALIAKNLAAEYSCYARPAASNLQICNSVLNEINNDHDFYIIQWSWIERFGYINDLAKSKNHPWNPLGWDSILPGLESDVSDFYYRNIHSQFRDKLETLICINTTINCLQQKNKKFLMTFVDDLIWESEFHATPAILYLQAYISPFVKSFESMGFFEWAKTKKFSISDKWHPLEDAHQAAADYFENTIKLLVDK